VRPRTGRLFDFLASGPKFSDRLILEGEAGASQDHKWLGGRRKRANARLSIAVGAGVQAEFGTLFMPRWPTCSPKWSPPRSPTCRISAARGRPRGCFVRATTACHRPVGCPPRRSSHDRALGRGCTVSPRDDDVAMAGPSSKGVVRGGGGGAFRLPTTEGPGGPCSSPIGVTPIWVPAASWLQVGRTYKRHGSGWVGPLRPRRIAPLISFASGGVLLSPPAHYGADHRDLRR